MVLINDVVDSYRNYCEWVDAGRVDDWGETLKRYVINSVRGFLLHSGSVDEVAMLMIKGSTDLPIKAISDTEVNIELPIDDDKMEKVVIQAR